MPSFDAFTRAMSHEIVETVSDPAGMGMGDFGFHELGDNCENREDAFTLWKGYSVSRYWSNFDKTCVPTLDPPNNSVSETWILGQGVPLQRFTGDVHDLNINVPASRVMTNAPVTQAILVIQTGGDDLRGGSNPDDNANVTLRFVGGSTETVNVNSGRTWENNQTHPVQLKLPTQPLRVSDITGITISTRFGGGISGDNWNVDKVALLVSFAAGSPVIRPSEPIVHEWLDASGGPLIRFTGSVHDLVVNVPSQDTGKAVGALDLIISTGNDDLRGGAAGDNCDVTIELNYNRTIVVNNANNGRNWKNWTDHTVRLPLFERGDVYGGEVKSVKLHTGFRGGIGGDNWNVQRIQLRATLK
jgi:hypothetical protein